MPKCLLTFIFLSAIAYGTFAQPSSFVVKQGHQFFIQQKQYNYIGANYWFGGLLGTTQEGQIRVKKELDFLVSKGINNLRVLAVAEGEGLISGVPRVWPAFQPQKRIYKEELLAGLDYLLSEMGKRSMKAVIYLSNNWEWSGGFLQYLNWNGQFPDSIMRKRLTWDEQRDYTSRFYNCKACIDQQYEVVKKIVLRTNTITHKKYKDDVAIMAWELANEPRPMRPAAVPAYLEWIGASARLIKSLDKNHLVTTGTEGDIGTEGMRYFSFIHSNKNIDYATIHIWPKNWGWFNDTSIAKSADTIYSNTKKFIQRHVTAMEKIDKPLVIEEFGLPRDEQLFSADGSTNSRDQYYGFVFEILRRSVQQNGVICGANFWAFGGAGRPSGKQVLWSAGDDLLGDPPVEEQGLNSVFDTDSSTWNIISMYITKLKK